MTTEIPSEGSANPYFDPAGQQAAQPGTQLATFTRADLEVLLAPYTVDLKTWAYALMRNDEFPEQDAEAMTLGILANILMAETSEAALKALDVQRAREMCGNEPGGRSDVLEVYGARPLKSDFSEGAACYVIVDALHLKTGERLKFTTGARAVQTVVLKHCLEGWLPFRCALEIRRERTRAGYHPLNMVAGI
jgi:hypothetical protein